MASIQPLIGTIKAYKVEEDPQTDLTPFMEENEGHFVKDDYAQVLKMIPGISRRLAHVERRVMHLQSGVDQLFLMARRQLLLLEQSQEDAGLAARDKSEPVEEFEGEDKQEQKRKPGVVNELSDAAGIAAAVTLGLVPVLLGALPQVVSTLASNGKLGMDAVDLGKELAGQGVRMAGRVVHGVEGIAGFAKRMFGFGGKAAAEGGEEAAEKGGAKLLGRVGIGAAKGIFKALPFVGSLFSFWSAYHRVQEGDYTGAIMDVGTGLLDLTGLGSIAAVGLTTLNALRDATDGGPDLGINGSIGALPKKIADYVSKLPGFDSIKDIAGGMLLATVHPLDGAVRIAKGVSKIYGSAEKWWEDEKPKDIGQWMSDIIKSTISWMKSNPLFTSFMKFVQGVGLLATGDFGNGVKMMSTGTSEFFSHLNDSVSQTLYQAVGGQGHYGTSHQSPGTNEGKTEHGRVGSEPETRYGVAQPITYRGADGKVEQKIGGTAAWRDNNPGNIVYGPFAKAHGAIGFQVLGGDGNRNAIFPTMEAGEAAQRDLLFKGKYSNRMISELNDGPGAYAAAHPAGYTEALVKAVGRNARLGDLNKEEQDRFIRQIHQNEGIRPGVTRVDDSETRTAAQSRIPPKTHAVAVLNTAKPKADAAKIQTPAKKPVRMAEADPPKASPIVNIFGDKSEGQQHGPDYVPSPSDNRGGQDYLMYFDAVNHGSMTPNAGSL